MVEGCGGHPTLDALLSRHRIMVRYCVVEESKLFLSHSMDTVGMVLVGYRWCTI